MKKLIKRWRDRRLRKWCVETVMRGHTYNPDRLVLAENLARWIYKPISKPIQTNAIALLKDGNDKVKCFPMNDKGRYSERYRHGTK